jgi:hypothetical protein
MRRRIGFFVFVAILVPKLLAPTLASAQQTQPKQGLPPDEVPAICPAGSYWVDAGYHGVGPKYRDGHCQKEFAHMPHSRSAGGH